MKLGITVMFTVLGFAWLEMAKIPGGGPIDWIAGVGLLVWGLICCFFGYWMTKRLNGK